jgi:hypothetical protein
VSYGADMMRNVSFATSALVLTVSFTGLLRGQHDAHEHAQPSQTSEQSEKQEHGSMTEMMFGGIPDTREASGTAWQPDATPMHAHHSRLGDWNTMTHYNVFLAYDDQSGARGDEQFNSINWLMLMATKRSDENELTFRTMLSLEPWTTTAQGYPLLFQSGEAYHGEPLIDRQHPHDFFMELAVKYRRVVADKTLLSLYVAPSGEPALGPPAFPHRMSSMDNPAAPISHHWLDSSHISFGVLTAGLTRDKWQIEGSWFNGREPDEDRWGIDLTRLDSYSGRLTWNPTPQWSAQVSLGYLKSPEELHPDDDLWRTTASLMHLKKFGDDSHLATTLGWGQNDTHGDKTNAVTLESNWTRNGMSVFGRAEYVEKTGDELDITPHERHFGIKQVSLGMTRELVRSRPWQLAIGGAATYTFKPSSLDALYGEHPIGFWIFLRLRPPAMAH